MIKSILSLFIFCLFFGVSSFGQSKSFVGKRHMVSLGYKLKRHVWYRSFEEDELYKFKYKDGEFTPTTYIVDPGVYLDYTFAISRKVGFIIKGSYDKFNYAPLQRDNLSFNNYNLRILNATRLNRSVLFNFPRISQFLLETGFCL